MTPNGSSAVAPPPTDASLLRRVGDGDEAAAETLYLRYAHRLRALAAPRCSGFANRFDADDVVQSVFRAFFQGAKRRAYTVPPGGELWGLLMVLGLNKVRALVEHHRAEKRAVGRTTGDLDRHPVLARDEAAADFLRLVVDEQLTGLPAAHREMVRLRLLGCQVDEISLRTGRSRRTVERVLEEFRSQMQKAK
jgi:RNA polymerase sigma-70 factor (ECF subfamily)